MNSGAWKLLWEREREAGNDFLPYSSYLASAHYGLFSRDPLCAGSWGGSPLSTPDSRAVYLHQIPDKALGLALGRRLCGFISEEHIET